MKMTKEQVAELMLKADDDFSNVEVKNMLGVWERTLVDNLKSFFNELSKGAEFRIKDNAVKEVTPALRGKWVRHKSRNFEMPIEYLDYTRQRIGIDDDIHDLEYFNTEWQLVED